MQKNQYGKFIHINTLPYLCVAYFSEYRGRHNLDSDNGISAAYGKERDMSCEKHKEERDEYMCSKNMHAPTPLINPLNSNIKAM